MRDYYPLLIRALSGLERNTHEARQAVYDRARTALLKQLRGVEPRLPESEITRERLGLEEAIRRIDGELALKEAASAPPSPAPGPPTVRPAVPPRPAVRPLLRPLSPAARQAAPAAAPAATERPPAPAVDLDSEALPAREPATAQAARPGSLRVGSGRIMRDGQRRAFQAKLLVGGLVVVLLLVAVGIGYLNRDRIFAFFGVAPGQVADKTLDRVSEPAKPMPAPAPGPAPAIPVGQRAVLYEENPGVEQLQTFVGTVVWRTETLSPGPGQPPEIGLRADMEIPDRRLTVTMTVRRNPDRNLPASHMMEAQFTAPNDPFGGVANMPGIRLKVSETAQGAPLAGLVVRVMPGFFLLGLSAVDSDREQNIQLLRERPWFDIPFVYNNGRRAVLAFEKGTSGERAMNEALAAWGN